jgi:hypothetical protein
MCLLVPPNCTHVKPQDAPYVVTKVIMVCCKIQSSNVREIEDWVTDVEKLFMQSEIEGQPFLKIDLLLMKPINIMARSSHNTE